MRLDQLLALCADLGLQQVTHNPNNVIALCPVHSETRPSFAISITKPGHPWNCFGCGAKGQTLVSLLIKAKGMAPGAARDYLERYGYLYESDPDGFREYEDLFQKTTPAAVSAHRLEAYPRLEEYRGLSKSVVRAANLRKDGTDALIIPFYRSGVLQGMVRKSPAIKMAPMLGFQFKQTLFRVPGEFDFFKPLILCEGFSDALRVWSYGFNKVAAINGTSFTDSQAQEVREITDRKIYCIFDRDGGGSVALQNVRIKLKDMDLYACKLVKKDPCDSSFREIVCSIKERKMLLG